MAFSAIDGLNTSHPVALELTNLRNAVSKLQDEVRQSALHIRRQAVDTSRANDRVTQLGRENTVLRAELGVLRAHADPDSSPDSHPATLQVQQMTLLLRQANAKITAVEEVLQTRNTELVHAKSDVVKARHAADGAYELAARIRGREEEGNTKQRELERRIRALEEEKRMSDLVISDYADLVRSLETKLGRRPATHLRASSSSSSVGGNHLQPNEFAASSTTTLAESISEGKNGLQKLLAEFSVESEQLNSEIERLQQDLDVAKAQHEAERKRGEQDRVTLAKALSELERAKLDDNSAAQMVSRYMKFSQSSTDKLQAAISTIRNRHDATINTLTAQLVDLSKKHQISEDEADELRNAVEELGGEMLKEIYGRRREVALRIRIIGREEQLQEQLNRWIRKGEDSLDRQEAAPSPDHVKWLHEAKYILFTLGGPSEPAESNASGSLMRIIAAEVAVESLAQELQAETTRRLELEKHLILKIPVTVEQDPAPLPQRPDTPQQLVADVASSSPPAKLLHDPVSMDNTPLDTPSAVSGTESPEEVPATSEYPQPTFSPVLSSPPAGSEVSIDDTSSPVLAVDSTTIADEAVESMSSLPSMPATGQEDHITTTSHPDPEDGIISPPRSPSSPSQDLAHGALLQEPNQQVGTTVQGADTQISVTVPDAPPKDDGGHIHEPSPKLYPTTSPLPGLQLSTEPLPLPDHHFDDELTPVATTSTAGTEADTEAQPFVRPLSPLNDAESSVPFLSLPNGDHLQDEVTSAEAPQSPITPAPPVHPLVSRLTEVGKRYDDLQRAFRDCHHALESLKAEVSSTAEPSTLHVSGSKIAPELLRVALDRLDDFTEDSRVELEIRKADEELLINGYQTLLSVPGALSSSPKPTFFSLFASHPPLEADDSPPPPLSEIETQVQSFVDGTDPAVQKAQESLQRKLDDVQHDIAALKQAIYNPDPSPVDSPDVEEPSKASSWTAWITSSPARLSKPLPSLGHGPPPTFGNVMTTPRLRHVSSLNLSSSSISMPSQTPRQSIGGDPRRNNDPFVALGLKIPMPSSFAHSQVQAAPTTIQLPSILSTPTESRAPRARTVSTMYMIGLGARSASGPPSLMNRPRTFSPMIAPRSSMASSVAGAQAPTPTEDGDVE
ncbi:hypothetical protein BDN72DRAFT_115225 [Pluteus cervinus]|uniref:Uncharacterized protein n=1 Tax=Pluteus cervinus TaxID=181527 RepID=A0ACD3AMG3_9AGAR|nr:hypothetical protein BDN72DRAFT_115225 [Pluteus cervinus]